MATGTIPQSGSYASQLVTSFGITKADYERIMSGRDRNYCDPFISPHLSARAGRQAGFVDLERNP